MTSNLWFEKGRDRILNAVSAGNFEEARDTVDVGLNCVGYTNPRGAFLSGAVRGIAANWEPCGRMDGGLRGKHPLILTGG